MSTFHSTFNPLNIETFFETRMYIDAVHVTAQHLLAYCNSCTES